MVRFCVRSLPILLAVALGACSDDSSSNNGPEPGPCEGSDPPPECTQGCTTDDQCGWAYYCDTDGTCTADCTPGGGQCAAGLRCGNHGRCVPADQCGDVHVNLTPRIPRVMLLIDQSGSMEEDFGQMDRWRAVRYALTDAQDGAVTKLQQQVRFAATLYYSKGGNEGGTCPILTRSAGTPPGTPKLDNRDAIDKLLADNDPGSDTPTAESIDAVAADMKAWAANPDNTDGAKVLLLATDGDPDTCAEPNAHDEASQKLSEEAVQRAYGAGILTYVLSVGSDVTEKHLNKLANAGLGKPLDPPDAPFYRGNDPAELVSAFNDIIRGVRDCVMTIDGKVPLDQANRGKVALNGEALVYDVDWRLKDEQTMELLGDACKTFIDTDTVSLEASFPCGIVIK